MTARGMPALEPVLHLPDRSTLAGFRSSGVHELEPYISPKVRSATVQGPSASSRPENTQDQARGAFRSTVWDGHIPADNVGFQLLKSFGWRVGSGLGAGEHGRREPIEPELPKGTRGLGFNSHTCELKCELTAQQRQQQEQRHNRKRAYTSDIGAPAPRSRSTDVVVALVRGELAQENLSDKVARHKQLMRVEQEQERGRSIERYMRVAFNDPFDCLRSDNSNPLSRPHNLRQSNPLLDPIRED